MTARDFLLPAAIFGGAALVFVAGLWLVAGSVVMDESTGYTWPAITCANPCIIEDDAGGIVDTYEAQGRLMAKGHVPVVVDGPCMSACTIFVDLDRANVCLTPRALLGYHKAARTDDDGKRIFEDVPYQTPGLTDYIKAHGGLPDPDSGHMLMLNVDEASQFYRTCAGA